MKATDYFKLKVERGELSTEDALKQSLQLLDDSSLFIDSLIEKYTELKSMTLKNLKQFDGHTKHEWTTLHLLIHYYLFGTSKILNVEVVCQEIKFKFKY